MTSDYNGSLTREQFLFYEIRTVAALMQQGLDREEILARIKQDMRAAWVCQRSRAAASADAIGRGCKNASLTDWED
jgi:hypothetical protein